MQSKSQWLCAVLGLAVMSGCSDTSIDRAAQGTKEAVDAAARASKRASDSGEKLMEDAKQGTHEMLEKAARATEPDPKVEPR